MSPSRQDYVSYFDTIFPVQVYKDVGSTCFSAGPKDISRKMHQFYNTCKGVCGNERSSPALWSHAKDEEVLNLPVGFVSEIASSSY